VQVSKSSAAADATDSIVAVAKATLTRAPRNLMSSSVA
jgi:hypothetical protein